MYPTILKSRFPGVFTNCFPEQPKLCSPQLQGSSFAYSLSHITEILNSAISLTIMMVKTATQETTSIYNQPSLFTNNSNLSSPVKKGALPLVKQSARCLKEQI